MLGVVFPLSRASGYKSISRSWRFHVAMSPWRISKLNVNNTSHEICTHFVFCCVLFWFVAGYLMQLSTSLGCFRPRTYFCESRIGLVSMDLLYIIFTNHRKIYNIRRTSSQYLNGSEIYFHNFKHWVLLFCIDVVSSLSCYHILHGSFTVIGTEVRLSPFHCSKSKEYE